MKQNFGNINWKLVEMFLLIELVPWKSAFRRSIFWRAEKGRRSKGTLLFFGFWSLLITIFFFFLLCRWTVGFPVFVGMFLLSFDLCMATLCYCFDHIQFEALYSISLHRYEISSNQIGMVCYLMMRMDILVDLKLALALQKLLHS